VALLLRILQMMQVIVSPCNSELPQLIYSKRALDQKRFEISMGSGFSMLVRQLYC
jgi:hypothetical protein